MLRCYCCCMGRRPSRGANEPLSQPQQSCDAANKANRESKYKKVMPDKHEARIILLSSNVRVEYNSSYVGFNQ